MLIAMIEDLTSYKFATHPPTHTQLYLYKRPVDTLVLCIARPLLHRRWMDLNLNPLRMRKPLYVSIPMLCYSGFYSVCPILTDHHE